MSNTRKLITDTAKTEATRRSTETEAETSRRHPQNSMQAIRAIEAIIAPITTTELLAYMQVEPSQELKDKAATISRLIDDSLIKRLLIKRLLEARDTAFSRLFRPGGYGPLTDGDTRIYFGDEARHAIHPDVPGERGMREETITYRRRVFRDDPRPVVPPVAPCVVYDEVRPMTREDCDRAEEALRGRPTYDPRIGRQVIDITTQGDSDGTD